jgi:predicted metal-binding membrane protein
VAVLRQLSAPVAIAVAVFTIAAWYVTWASSDVPLMISPGMAGATDLVLFSAILVVMMVAMMFPAAVPMILTYHGITRLEEGRPTKPADALGTALFTTPYFLVWGGFAVAAVLAIASLGLMGPMTGPAVFLPAATLIAAGAYQATRTKEICLTHCQSPAMFVFRHWRSGRLGAVRMGLRHSVYCIGCCWLLMLVLFVAGAMSLAWMAAISVAIFVEKVGLWPTHTPRIIGVLLVGIGVLFAAQAVAM